MQACDFTARVARAAVLHTLYACVSCKAACSAAAVETSADQLIVVSCRWHQLACSACMHSRQRRPCRYSTICRSTTGSWPGCTTCSLLKEGALLGCQTLIKVISKLARAVTYSIPIGWLVSPHQLLVLSVVYANFAGKPCGVRAWECGRRLRRVCCFSACVLGVRPPCNCFTPYCP